MQCKHGIKRMQQNLEMQWMMNWRLEIKKDLKMDQATWDNGKVQKDMGMDRFGGLMVLSTKDIGWTVNNKERVYLLILMEISTEAIGWMAFLMVKVSYSKLQNITNKPLEPWEMKALNFGQIDRNMSVNSCLEKNMVMENQSGKIKVLTMDNG